MALANFAGSGYLDCTISCWTHTGYTVDHLPSHFSTGGKIVSDYGVQVLTNTHAKVAQRTGIGSIRVAMVAPLAEDIDYLCIDANSIISSGKDAGASDVAYPGGLTGKQLLPIYYFVTGYAARNGGICDLTIMCDCATTLFASIGRVNIAIFGGMITRQPISDRGAAGQQIPVTEYNTLAEPFTTTHPVKKEYQVIQLSDVSKTINHGAFILSPYDLVGEQTYLKNLEVLKRTGVTKNRTTITEAQQEAEGSTETSGTTEVTKGKAEAAAGVTQFAIGAPTDISKGIPSGNYGLQAFDKTQKVVENISSLYANGITNSVADAYICAYSEKRNGSSPNGNSNDQVNYIYGINDSITLPGNIGSMPKFDKTNKTTYYGAQVTILSLATGEYQTVPLCEAVNGDGNITIDACTDPSPDGGIYWRIRKTTDSVEDARYTPLAMMPGGIKSGAWKKVTIMATINGQGVEAGQTFRSAELDIDENVARLNQAATTAQYDLTAGNGYLLKNAGNEYGLAALNGQMISNYVGYGADVARNQISAITNAATSVSSVVGGATRSTFDASLKGNVYNPDYGKEGAGIAGLIGAAANQQLNNAASNFNLAFQEQQYGVNKRQLEESGDYNTQLTLAQKNAASAIAQANIDKINLAREKLSDFPSIPLLSIAKGGLIQGYTDRVIVIYSYLDPDDQTRLASTMRNFGQTVYNSASNDSYNPLPLPRAWNYYKVEPGFNWKRTPYNTGPSLDFPAWMLRGAKDQLSGGVWFEGEKA